MVRSLNKRFNYLKDKSFIETENLHLWESNDVDHNLLTNFDIEVETYQKKLRALKEHVETFWNELNIEEFESIYVLKSTNSNFNNISKIFNTGIDNIICLHIKDEITVNDITYTVLVNTHLYFVLSSKQISEEEFEDDIYDWGIVDLPRFAFNREPIFNVTLPEANLVYGLSTTYSLYNSINRININIDGLT